MKKDILIEISTSIGQTFCKSQETFDSFDEFRKSLDNVVYFLSDDKYLIEVFDTSNYNKVSFYADNGTYLGGKEDVMKKLRTLFGTEVKDDAEKTWSFTTVD